MIKRLLNCPGCKRRRMWIHKTVKEFKDGRTTTRADEATDNEPDVSGLSDSTDGGSESAHANPDAGERG